MLKKQKQKKQQHTSLSTMSFLKIWCQYCSLWHLGRREIDREKEDGKQPWGSSLCNPNWIEKPAFERCLNPHAATSERLHTFINAETWEQTDTFLYILTSIFLHSLQDRKAKACQCNYQFMIHTWYETPSSFDYQCWTC